MRFYWLRKDCSEKKTGKQEEPISRESGISNCSISADCVGRFRNFLRSIWQCSLVRNVSLHETESYFLSFSFNRLRAWQDYHYAAAETERTSWRSVGFPTLQTGMTAVLKLGFFMFHQNHFFSQHLFPKHSTRPLAWKWCIAVFRKFIYCLVEFPHDSTVKCMSQSLTA